MSAPYPQKGSVQEAAPTVTSGEPGTRCGQSQNAALGDGTVNRRALPSAPVGRAPSIVLIGSGGQSTGSTREAGVPRVVEHFAVTELGDPVAVLQMKWRKGTAQWGNKNCSSFLVRWQLLRRVDLNPHRRNDCIWRWSLKSASCKASRAVGYASSVQRPHLTSIAVKRFPRPHLQVAARNLRVGSALFADGLLESSRIGDDGPYLPPRM
jgi:hypothetical protein